MTKRRLQKNHGLPQHTYSINNAWYFELRDGGQKGPYDTKDEMHAALQEFIQLHNEVIDKS